MSVVSCNVNGSVNIQTFVNRHVYNRGIFQPAIICLQELKITAERVDKIRNYFPSYRVFISTPSIPAGNNAQRGVLLAIHKKLNPKILKIYRGDGWYILAKCVLDDITIWLGSVYIAIRHVAGMYVQLYKEISERIINEDREVFKIIAGDYNTVLSNIDSSSLPYKPRTVKLEEFMNENELLDVWRIQHPDEVDYTRIYISMNGIKGGSRLDYILVSQSLLKFVSGSLIGVKGGGDHCAIKMDLNFADNTKKVFRFPPSLLKDKMYRLKLKERIEQLRQDNIEASDQTLWELIKCEVRSVAVKHIKQSRKIARQLVSEVEKKAHEQRVSQVQIVGKGADEEIDTLFEQSDKDRLKTNWANSYGKQGTSSKYFFNKIRNKLKYVDIQQIRDFHGNVTEDNSDVLQTAADFYDELYRYRPVHTSQSWSDTVLPQIEEDDIADLDSDISLGELGSALKTLRKGKAPGNDGLMVEFYVEYWNIVGSFLHRALLDSINKNILGPSQRDGLIRLIPKKGKDLLEIANWRGICLLNVDYKIFTKALTIRLRDIMPKIIHPDQKGFVKDRRIAHAVYDLYAVQNIVEEEQLDVVLEALDIRKAFDSLSWDFLNHAYECFGFPEKFRAIIQMLYKERNIYISNRGELSTKLRAGRGCPQGDPLSPINFIVAIELFAARIRYNDNITPISVLDCDKKLNLVADDVLFMYQNSVRACRAVTEEIRIFEQNSGLVFNEEKCALMRIGKHYRVPLSPYRRPNIPRHSSGFRYVGINYKVDHREMTISTFEGKITETLKALADAPVFLRNQPLLSRIYGIRAMYWSKLGYLLYIMPNMSKDNRSLLRTRFFEAIWRNKRHMVNKQIAIMPVRLGGLGAMDIETDEQLSKIMCIREIFREITVSPQFWQIHLQSLFRAPLEKIVEANLIYAGVKGLMLDNKKLPRFWEECFKEWCRFHYSNGNNLSFDAEEVMHRPVHWNSMLKGVDCDKIQHVQCLEEWDVYVVVDIYNIATNRVPRKRPRQGNSCVTQSLVDKMKSDNQAIKKST